MRHMWRKWNKMERCARRGCSVLRRRVWGERGGVRVEYKQSYEYSAAAWSRQWAPCEGEPSTNKIQKRV